MTTNEFNFSEMVCFSLYSTANSMIREYRPELEKFDLTYPQFLVMMSLWNQDVVYIKELSEQTYLDAGTLTQILKRLENKGFIQRTKSKKDERAKVIVLTEEGKLLKDKTSHIFNDMECRLKLTKEEQKEITILCNKILTRLR
ncbi:MarR family transcriptional regulator [Gammaproteobacteria bacterium 42_54_T18]|nr:MarR family transcriptional regulator [Gammaproteobacteria bacterium 42_54_T18]